MMGTLTSCHYSLQTNDIGMVKLGHDAGFAQKISPLFFSVADLQSLQGHGDVPLPRQPHTAVTHFPELSCGTGSHTALLTLQTFVIYNLTTDLIQEPQKGSEVSLIIQSCILFT